MMRDMYNSSIHLCQFGKAALGFSGTLSLAISRYSPHALDLVATSYAKAMAEAFAMMHWGARIDANDVEFVLAPLRAAASAPSFFQSDYLGPHSLWILDSDC
ncbi:hypothetical protein PMIN04_005732 [Paraphaeosphaeria minitans]